MEIQYTGAMQFIQGVRRQDLLIARLAYAPVHVL
jgi:hypothetical protein